MGGLDITLQQGYIAHFMRKFGCFPSSSPPIEQRAIAAFLDRETARIDALMEKKQRQIELLQEKRTALISHAVTKGLDPTAPMKDSGVEWLGQIPAHWELKIKYIKVHSDRTLGKIVTRNMLKLHVPSLFHLMQNGYIVLE